MDMSELYGIIVQLRELSCKKDALIDELMDTCKKLQAENEKLHEENQKLNELVEWLE